MMGALKQGTLFLMDKITQMLTSNLPDVRELGKVLKREQDLRENLGLPTVRWIQERVPSAIVTGSVGMYLHGFRLERWEKNITEEKIRDIDIILPYYQSLIDGEELFYNRPESNEFDYIVQVDKKIIDVCINPKIKYRIIRLDDFDYKVGLIEDLIEAKIRYIRTGYKIVKHREDIYSMLGILHMIQTPVEIKEPISGYGGS